MQQAWGQAVWKVIFTKQAMKDARNVKRAGLTAKVDALLTLLAEDPYRTPPPYERLVGDLVGQFSRRINIQHRLVYKIDPDTNTVKIIRMWTHYE